MASINLYRAKGYDITQKFGGLKSISKTDRSKVINLILYIFSTFVRQIQSSYVKNLDARGFFVVV